MQTWEYANQSFAVGDPEAELRGINRLGADGWEIYAVTTGISTFNTSIATYYCKRPVQDADG